MINNTVILIGNATRKPELRNTPNNVPVTDVTLAISGKKKADGTRDTVFVRVDVWGKQAETLCTYLGKGDQLHVRGSLVQVPRQTQSGETYTELRVRCDEFEFGRRAKANEQSTQGLTTPVETVPTTPQVAPVVQPVVTQNPAYTTPATQGPGQTVYVQPAQANVGTENELSMGQVFTPDNAGEPVSGALDGYY